MNSLEELDRYFNEVKQSALNNTNFFSIADYDANFPEYYFSKLVLSMGMSMAEKTKSRIQSVSNRKCEQCTVLGNNLNKANTKLSEIAKRYNILLSFVRSLDPIRTQNFLDSQNMELLSPEKDRRGFERSPLTPVKANNSRSINVLRSPSLYYSPKNVSKNSRESGLGSQNFSKNTVGSPLHCSTQSSICGNLNLVFDENMKIKNSLTPKKKKKEISPVKKSSPKGSNVLLTQPAFLMRRENRLLEGFNDSNESIEMLPETPPDIKPGQQIFEKERGLKINKSVPMNVDPDVMEEDGEDPPLTPLIVRPSEMIDAMKHSRTPERIPNDDLEDSMGISPSIMSYRTYSRNLMSGDLGAVEETNLGDDDMSSLPSPSHLPNLSSKENNCSVSWVTNVQKPQNSSTFMPFKQPLHKQGKRYKQITLPQMKKRNAKSVNVDITTLEEFDGGSRSMKKSGRSQKRKSDEKLENENMPGPSDKQKPYKVGYDRGQLEHADETHFEVLVPATNTPKPSSSKICKREKKELNNTAELIAELDKLPNRQSQQEPNFAYKPERAIRKREERLKLKGWECDDCKKYYEAMQDSVDENFIQNLKNQCSKHRAKHPVNQHGTPKGFWDVDFQSTIELKRTKAFQTDTYVDSEDDGIDGEEVDM